MPDQLRSDFLPTYGCSGISTPNIDALAAQSTVYERAYSNCPLCVPARAALISGLNPLRNGVLDNSQWLRPDRAEMGLKTWPDVLRERGYWTAAIGKMHFYPFDSCEGFDERVIAEDKRWVHIHDDYAEYLAQHGIKKFNAIEHPDYVENMGAVTFPHAVEFTPDRFVSNASVDFIKRQPKERPFALMIGYPSPHCPYDALPEYTAQVDPDGLPPLRPPFSASRPGPAAFMRSFYNNHRQSWHAIDYKTFPEETRIALRSQYAGLVKQIDDEVGRIIQACKDADIWDNTLFVFTSDHGDHVGDRGMVGKGDFFEESIHIPLIVKQPNQRNGQRLQTPVELQQIPPTIMQTADTIVPPWWDYAPLPEGDEPSGETFQFGILSDTIMARKGPWKLIQFDVGNYVELYNLDDDPDELHDRSDDPNCQAVRIELSEQLLFWVRQQALLGHADKRLPAGLLSNGNFSRCGWKRTYPQPIV